ncbi:chromophore lyase CpcT/CpeT [Prochlorococcus sp. MIT 1341]|uniref:chromophore lyase CpcT/CpeT n=1 Tax=Prochlorococcus sp. MIT 1341 TaxID=3096221 RepID=UPI002A75B021|nr:chromophore lyase CpcT/CpeT [Prochlorococcus sp. MIT 1341]
MKKNPIVDLGKVLAGKYSNRDQAYEHSKLFAHINIYFLPIDWEILNGPGFYSEQSHDYSPWSPYRQSINHLSVKRDIIVLKNYGLKDSIRFAGAGHHPELLEEIKAQDLFYRKGCDMHFKKISQEHFTGRVEPGEKCLIEREGQKTCLVSNVKVLSNLLITYDKGIDISSRQKSWGSDHGPLIFKKIFSWENLLPQKWGSKQKET